MTELTLRDAVRQEHEVRLARRDVALLDEAVGSATSNRERSRSRSRATQARERLVRALLRRLLPPGPETDGFAAEVQAALGRARYASAVLDDLVAALDSIPIKEKPDDRS